MNEPGQPEAIMTDCNVEPGADYGRGYYAALDHICHFINALDSSEMTARDVRSAIYGECLSARPRISPCTDEDVSEAMIDAGANAYGIKHQSTCYPSASDWECADAAKAIYAAMRAASPDQTIAAWNTRISPYTDEDVERPTPTYDE